MKGHRRGLLASAVGLVLLGGFGSALAAEGTLGTAPAPQREWADEVKNPTSWLNWGADLRLREEYFNNAITLNDEAANHEWNFQRYRARAWATVTPVENVAGNLRLTWEGRHWTNPEIKRDVDEWDWSNIVIDNANVKLTNVAGTPVSVTAGRQDIIFGEGWLILDGTPLDGSRTIFFDAARFTVDLKEAKTAVNLIYIDQASDPNRWLPTIGNDDIPLTEQDERGGVLYVTNKSVENMQLDGYFIYKNDNRVLANGDEGDIYTLGARVAHQCTDHIKARVEGAYQFGNRENPVLYPGADDDLSAYGFNSRVTYAFNDEWKNQLHLSFEYLSGDDPDSSTNEAFDPLWARWPQFSELLVYTYAGETRIAEVTNLIRFGPGYQVAPTKKMDLIFNYYLLFANQNTYENRAGFSDDDLFRGHLVTALMKYKFNRFVAGHLIGEYFAPGDYYGSRDDDAVYLRAELYLTF